VTARVYAEPPLQEALCEFRFRGDTSWDWTVPGMLWERIGSEFPRKESKTVLPKELLEAGDLPLELRQATVRAQFFSESGSRLVQVGPDLLTVNVLPPYPGWIEFRPLILRVLETYREIAAPAQVERIGLRYINRVTVPSAEIELSDYFRAAIGTPSAGVGRLAGFLSVADFQHEGDAARLRYQFGSVEPGGPGESAYLVDLDAFVAADGVPDWPLLSGALDRLHEIVEQAFEGTFTDRTREEIFKEAVV
jgi:uncharacterized protein (TIGR04255 family)